uniref:BCD1 alpha/beta domain-containing protein n=1 Tax=Panagrolaimus davidi TaxID=227884 RepID=A0A914QTC6_9BILA
MQPFWDEGLNGVFVFMKVLVGEKERYNMVDKSKSILNNLRNCYIIGHPEFIVILPNQFRVKRKLKNFMMKEDKVRHQNDGGNHIRGNFNRRNGGRGGGNHFGGKGGGFRGRNRGRSFRGGHRGGGGRNRELASRDLSDIFEPFSSPAVARISRPNYSSNSKAKKSLIFVCNSTFS